MTRTRWWAAGAAAVLMLTAGCGGEEDPAAGSTSATAEVSASATTAPPDTDVETTTATAAPTPSPTSTTSAAPSPTTTERAAGPVPSAAPGEEGYHLYALDLLRQRMGADCGDFEGDLERSIAYVAQCTISGRHLVVLYTGETGADTGRVQAFAAELAAEDLGEEPPNLSIGEDWVLLGEREEDVFGAGDVIASTYPELPPAQEPATRADIEAKLPVPDQAACEQFLNDPDAAIEAMVAGYLSEADFAAAGVGRVTVLGWVADHITVHCFN